MNSTLCTPSTLLRRRRGLHALGLFAFGAALAATGPAQAGPGIHGALQAAPDPQTIVGGDVNAGDPSVPLLVVYGEAGEQSICTGSLVGPQWILTAAHCVDVASLGFEPVGIEVYFGTQYSEQDPGYLGSTYADNYAYHELWNTNDMESGHDIAVVHVVDAVDLPLMPLLARPLSSDDLGAPARLIGWGLTLGDRQDSGVKRHVMSSVFDFNDLLVQIGDDSTNVCSGDSGGPAVMQIDGMEVQFGITSFGDTACTQIGIDTRVDAFADWIADATGGEVVPAVTGSSAPGGSHPAPPAPGGEPTPGAGPTGGTECQTHEDCAGGLCVSDGSQSLCTTTCTSDADCGANMGCFATDDPEVGVCWPDDQPSTIDPEEGTDEDEDPGADEGGADDDDQDISVGCAVARGRSVPTGFALMLGLLWFGRRRRG